MSMIRRQGPISLRNYYRRPGGLARYRPVIDADVHKRMTRRFRLGQQSAVYGLAAEFVLSLIEDEEPNLSALALTVRRLSGDDPRRAVARLRRLLENLG